MSDDSFFEGGDKVLGFSYDGQPPITWDGTVTEVGKAQQAREVNYNPQTKQYETGEPKEWKDGNPILHRRVVVQTTLRETPDDDGRRCWYMEQGKQITKAMMSAVEEVRGKGKSMPEVGGWLSMTFTATDPESFKASKKLFTGQYRDAVADPWPQQQPQAQQQWPASPPAQQQAYAPPPPQQQQWPPQGQPPPAYVPAAPAVSPVLVQFLASKNIDASGMGPEQAQLIANSFPDAPR